MSAGKIAEAGKYLTFTLCGEEYAIGITRVREIIELMQFTKIPLTPGYSRGVINLRGTVVPVIGLREKFSMPHMDDSKETCIIVVETHGAVETKLYGLVVDAVSEVLDIKKEQIEPAVDFGAEIDASCIDGLAKTAGPVKILLNIDRVLKNTSDEKKSYDEVKKS